MKRHLSLQQFLCNLPTFTAFECVTVEYSHTLKCLAVEQCLLSCALGEIPGFSPGNANFK